MNKISPLSVPFSDLHSLAVAAIHHNHIQTSRGSFFRAGAHQFSAFWTRDFCFAVPGILSCGSAKLNLAVRDHLSRLLDNLHPETDLAARMFDSRSSSIRILTHTIARKTKLYRWLPSIREPLIPEYLGEHGTIAIDSNILLLRACAAYLRVSQDFAWANKMQAAFLRAWRFYEKHSQDGIIYQGKYQDWQDSAHRVGASSYVNILYFSFCKMDAGILGISLEPKFVETLRLKFLEHFFHPESGLIRALNKRPEIALDATLLAIEAEVWADSTAIWTSLKQNPIWTNFVLPACPHYPNYANGEISWTTKIVGLRHYHDQFLWTWLAALSAKVAMQMQDFDEANRILSKLEAQAVRDNGIYEILENDVSLTPVERAFYQSESPFTWAAGIILQAIASGAFEKNSLGLDDTNV
jgi:glycogen debranching enzyme